ncbi:MAG: hypothetical protein ACRCSU_08545 [Paracoccaceae bacterium]
MRHSGTAVLTILALPGAALAHSGHGLRGGHLHGDDAALIIVVALSIITLALFVAQKSGKGLRVTLQRFFRGGGK